MNNPFFERPILNSPCLDDSLGRLAGLVELASRSGRTALTCKGGAKPAQLLSLDLANMACERITAAITRSLEGACASGERTSAI